MTEFQLPECPDTKGYPQDVADAITAQWRKLCAMIRGDNEQVVKLLESKEKATHRIKVIDLAISYCKADTKLTASDAREKAEKEIGA